MRRNREQEPIMNVYSPPSEPSVRTAEPDFVPHSRSVPPRTGRADRLAFAQLAAQGEQIGTGAQLRPVLISRNPADFVRTDNSGVLTLAGGVYFVTFSLSGRGGADSVYFELLPYDGETPLSFARQRNGLVPPHAFGLLTHSFLFELRNEASPYFVPSVDDGAPFIDYVFSLTLVRLR